MGTMMERTSNENAVFGSGMVLGSLIGGLIGAGLALWFTPQSGHKTQQQVRREVNRLQKQVGHTADEVVNEATHKIELIHEQANEFVEDKLDKANKLAKNAKQAIAQH